MDSIDVLIALENSVKKLQKGYYDSNNPHNDFNAGARKCATRVLIEIDQLKRITSGWFNIKEKQPEVGQEVITYHSSYKHGVVMKHCYYNGIDEDGDYRFIETETSRSILGVTHWRLKLIPPNEE